MTKSSIKARGQRGFTLVELISVIIILGILAAVITPKYLDMTEKATEAVSKGVKSEAVARFNMAYAKYMMVNHAAPADVDALVDAGGEKYLGADVTAVDIGDYILDYSGGGATAVSVAISGDTGITPDPTANWTAAQKALTIPWPD